MLEPVTIAVTCLDLKTPIGKPETVKIVLQDSNVRWQDSWAISSWLFGMILLF